jgi:hypothetical protein
LKSNYNLEGSSVPLTGTPDGGEFEGPGILDNELFPDLVGSVATINVKYTYTDSLTGCANDTTISTDIRKADVSILGLESTYCYDSIRDTITVDKYTYTNGHFLGRGIDSIGSDSIVFNPVLAGNGYDTIIYRYYDDSTLYEVSRVTRVDSLGPPVISNLKDAYCAGDPLANINGTLIHPNGFGTFTFSDPTPLFVNQGNSATLDPDASLADSLPYTVTYTYESLISGCQRSISKNTLIQP